MYAAMSAGRGAEGIAGAFGMLDMSDEYAFERALEKNARQTKVGRRLLTSTGSFIWPEKIFDPRNSLPGSQKRSVDLTKMQAEGL